MNNSRIILEFKGGCLKQDKATFTPNNVVNLFIVYELYRWSRDLNTDFTLKNCLFGSVKLAKNADPDKYQYSGHGIGVDSRSEFSLTDSSIGKSVIIFGVDMSSSLHIDNKNKDILVLGREPTQGLDNTTLTAEAEYSINFSRSQRKFCLSFHYNGSNSFLFVNAIKIYQFKAKKSQIKPYLLCFGNISKEFTPNNMQKKKKKKTELNRYIYNFSVDYNIADTSKIINIHIFNASNHTKCVCVSNQKCKIQPTLINLHPNNTVKNYTTIHLR